MMSIYRKKPSLTRALRLLLAFFIAPSLSSAPFFLIHFIPGIVTLMYGLFVSVFFGFPAYTIMKSKKIVNLRSYVLVGGFVGSIPVLSLSISALFSGHGIEPFLNIFAICVPVAGFSSIGGLLFWLIARPDLT
ncbi:hypothetical protein [Azospirillum cavernae]|uniref:hypothetical protein n=1 Tax=Azospirillum cavernae TaxID=2320860 RepID=UPI0011C4A44B|nr:hypothetical protein [Azospirillum cavernae]